MDISTLGSGYEPIEKFYSGKSILITGGTGFLGKVLIEKLVYSCPSLKCIYLLVRENKNDTGVERFNKILNSKVFSRVREHKPEVLEKIHFVTGDITSHDLGMKDEDRSMFLDKVSIIFHLAATVRFNEPLREAMRVNVEGTRNMIRFAQSIPNLQAFVYMSTAYCNTDKVIVEERVYPPPMDIQEVYSYLKLNEDSDQIEDIIKDRPNTYTFTKALSDSLVADIRGDMPTVIIRPSMVVASMHEPMPGWIDTWLGPTPALDLIARGWLKYYFGKHYYALDIIPVDFVINATIVAAARCRRSKRLPVYNCCSSSANSLTLEEIYKLYTEQSIRTGYNELPIFMMIFTKSLFITNLIKFMSFTLVAYIFDFLLILRRKPVKHVKRMQKSLRFLNMTKFVTSQNWYISSTRLRDLVEDLDVTDQKKFPCNPADIQWSEFIPIYFNGVRKFLNGTQI